MNKTEVQVVLMAGCNRGHCFEHFRLARQMLTGTGVLITSQSACYQTSAWGPEQQPDFLNQCWIARTGLAPLDLLHVLKHTERATGRTVNEKWKEREIDIDIIFYDRIVFAHPELIIPHPLMHERRFVLEPLNELIPEFIHPVLKKTVACLLNECSDNGTIKRLQKSKQGESI